MVISTVVLGLVLVLLFVRNQSDADMRECIHSLYHLSETKWAWAEAHHATTNDTPTWEDLRPYYNVPTEWPTNAPAPRCPGGGTWIIGKIGEAPSCSIGKHAAALRHEIEEQRALIEQENSRVRSKPPAPQNGTNL